MADFGPLTPITGYHANILTNRNGSVDNADSMHTHVGLAITTIDCDGAVVVGDFVYVDSNDHVAKAADNTNPNVVGVVVAKNSITNCTIANTGKVSIFSGLVFNNRYYLSVTGTLTTTPPATGWIIPVGTALSASSIMLNFQIPQGRA